MANHLDWSQCPAVESGPGRRSGAHTTRREDFREGISQRVLCARGRFGHRGVLFCGCLPALRALS
jgi:hypothetical protein